MADHHHTCSVCNGLFNSPRTLACGHTFCTTCLVQWFFRDRRPCSRSCPICREVCRNFPAVNVVMNAYCEGQALACSEELRASRARNARDAADVLRKVRCCFPLFPERVRALRERTMEQR